MASEQAIAAAGLAGTFGIGARDGGIRWDDAAQQAAYDAAERATRTDMNGRYAVAGYDGVAFRLLGYAQCRCAIRTTATSAVRSDASGIGGEAYAVDTRLCPYACGG
jgi:photosystem II stability/assembly factor-like uncharacterized protein